MEASFKRYSTIISLLSEMLATIRDPLFTCPDHDFTIQSLPDGSLFQVEKSKLTAGSGVFRDMFDVVLGNDGSAAASKEETTIEQRLDVHEPSDLFLYFIKLLHGDIGSLETTDQTESVEEAPEATTASTPELVDIADTHLRPRPVPRSAIKKEPLLVAIIPMSLLLPLWNLLDKYDVPASPYHQIVESQIKANAEKHPLEIYGLAHQHDLTSVAAHTSQYLISKPMEHYSLDEIVAHFPSAKAYHRIVLLQAHRKWKLKEILRTEEIFPRGYGFCSVHGSGTKAHWDSLKKDLEPRVTGATDLPSAMAVMKGSVQACYKCNRACIMAIDMLRYKVDKVPKTFDGVPGTM
ncbi:hypothetical protein FRB94_004015 [Tulasnella sp. JGI-2019a]|nr:hypothetical protein FRB93_003348 [Tulasnella sp. JGI-2019a]KAG9002273.1 hypothetical protein FRB94_004015 [Tulasnella sp. JGI-2019a]KAG9032844.1 hypothetical protein FRB95_000928 [Tulasnella sp. JGI-2019a]